MKCYFDFHSFPHDVQNCQIEFGSFSYGLGRVRFENLELYFEGEKVKSPSFEFVEDKIFEKINSENISICVVELNLQRCAQFYVYQVFLFFLAICVSVNFLVLKKMN